MADQQFNGISLHPEDAMMNIEALVNAALFLNMVRDRQTATDLLTLASDYVAAIRRDQNGGAIMINMTSGKEAAPAPQPSKCRSQIKVNACGGINSIAEDAITFVHRFACILKAKPERPPVIVLSTARTESEARESLMKGFEGKMRLIWAGRLPRKQCARGGLNHDRKKNVATRNEAQDADCARLHGPCRGSHRERSAESILPAPTK